MADRLCSWIRTRVGLDHCLEQALSGVPRAWPAQQSPVLLSPSKLVSPALDCIMNRLDESVTRFVASPSAQAEDGIDRDQRSLNKLLAGLLPKALTFSPSLEQQYRDARARSWWKRDVWGYMVLLFLVGPLYVIATCYLDAQAAAAVAGFGIGSDHTLTQPGKMSTLYDAPSAAQYYKQQLYPRFGAAGAATSAICDHLHPSAAAAIGATAAADLSLQQLLFVKAAAAASKLATYSSSSSSSTAGTAWRLLSVLLQPQQLLLLYLWRVGVQGDLALLCKSATGAVALVSALMNPGVYCTHKVRTALVAAYVALPLLLLPLQLLLADASISGSSSTLLMSQGLHYSSSSSSNAAHVYADCPAAAGCSGTTAAAAAGYRAVLSYAPLIVLLNSGLQPLPFLWQAVVNVASWASLAVAGVILRLKFEPIAAAAAASAGSSSSGSRASVDLGVLSFELVSSSIDGLLLAVLLPLMLRAWRSRRARKAFLRTGHTSSVSNSTVVEHFKQQPQQQQRVDSVTKDLVADDLPDAVPSNATAAAAITRSDQLRSCIGSVGSNSSMLRKQAATAAAKPYGAAAAGIPPVPPAGQFCIVRGITVPASTAATAVSAASATISGSSPPSSSTGSSLDQPPTPITVLEPRSASNGSKMIRVNLPILSGPSIQAARYSSRSGSSSSSNPSPSCSAASSGSSRSGRQQGAAAAGDPSAVLDQGYGTRSPQRPSALYTSPLETVVISFKLATAPPPAAAAATPAGNETDTSRSRSASPTPPLPAAAAAVIPSSFAGIVGPLIASSSAATAGGHAGGLSHTLKAEIEAAVRQVVSQSEYHVICTSVSTFPGCVHVVVNLQICKAAELYAQLTAAAAADGSVRVDQAGSSSDVEWGKLIDWSQVVRQLQQYRIVEDDQGVARLAAPAAAAADPAAAAAAGGSGNESSATGSDLQLQYMLVQDGSGQDQWYWQSPAAAAAAAAAKGDGSSSGNDEDNMQSASSSTSKAATSPPSTPLLVDSAAAIAAGGASPTPVAAAAGLRASDDVRFSRQEILALQTLAGEIPGGSGTAESDMRLLSQLAMMSQQTDNDLVGQPAEETDSARNSSDSLASTAASSSGLSPGQNHGPRSAWWQQQQQQQGSASLQVRPMSSFLPRHAEIHMGSEQTGSPSVRTAASATAAAMNVAAAVHGYAQGTNMSGLTVPSDQGWLEMMQGPDLRLPNPLGNALAAAAAGLRVVITTAASSPTAAAGDGSSSPFTPADPASLKPLVDTTFWPVGGSSSSSCGRSWPSNGQIALQRLLPAGTQGSWLVSTYGNVMSVNILATPGQQAAARGSSSGSRVIMPECLLLQLPLLLVPSAVCEGLEWLGVKMAREAGSWGVAFSQHMLPLVRDIASLLLGPQTDCCIGVESPMHRGTTAALDAAAAGTGSKIDQDLLQQQQEVVYKWLAANVLGFLESQGAQECAAELQRIIQQHLPAAAAAAAAAAAPSALDTAVDLSPGSEIIPIEPDLTLDTVVADKVVETAAAADDVITSSPTSATAAAAADQLEKTDSEPDLIKPLLDPSKAKSDQYYAAAAAAAKSNQFSVAEALKAAAAAAEDAAAVRNTVNETTATLQAALHSLTQLSATAAAAEQQARRAESAAALAARRAAAAEAHTQRQRALYLIGGGHVESGMMGQGVWGLLGSASRTRREAAVEVLSSPPVLPEAVSERDVLLGFSDARLEVQYRRLKALQIRCVDQAALAVQVLKEATIVWKIARALHAVSDTRLSLVLLCKYEAVTLLPYLMSLAAPDFWVQHRNFMIMLSQIACALTVGMITATEIYRHEWAQLLHPESAASNLHLTGFEAGTSGPQDLTLISRPGMLVAWFYVVVPLLQQLCVPDQLVSCAAQAVQTYLAYRFIFGGTMGLGWLLGWLGLGAVVSAGVAYVADLFMRRQAVSAARRSLMAPRGNGN